MNDSPIYRFLEPDAPAPLRNLLSLLLILFVCTIPLLMSLSRADSNRTMENITVLSSQETWMRWHGTDHIAAEPDAYLIPTRNSVPRFEKPPLTVWLNLLAYTGLKPGQDMMGEETVAGSPQDIIYRSRLVAVASSLLLLVGVFWIGLNLGDHKFAIIATLATGTMWFFQKQARIGSYDIELAAFSAMSVASLIAAIKPFRPTPKITKTLIFTALSGFFAAAAVMTKGWPLGILWSFVPIITTIILTPKHRLRSTLLLVSAMIVAVAIAAPWFIYALMHYPEAAQTWWGEYKASRQEYQIPVYYFGLLGLVLPWSLFLFGSFFQPYVRAGGLDRRKLLVPWLWFMVLFVILSIPGAKQQRYILPIIPAAGLLIAQLLRWHVSLAANNERDPGGNFMIYPQWIGFVCASIGLFVVQILDYRQIGAVVPKYILGPLPMSLVIVTGPTLVLIAYLGFKEHVAFKKPMKAIYLAAAWMLVASTTIWLAYSASPDRNHPIRVEAERVSEVIGKAPMYVLFNPSETDAINEEFLIYTQRIVPRVSIENIKLFTADLRGKTYMIADEDKINDALMKQFGWKPVLEFKQDKRRVNVLYVKNIASE
ncbi:hypothetical protein KS4_17100 [Poriferisphaera corsica]|uniref:Glycosyltransferase RgtA/B/C/D-like domain-containing protein n=1 Tax=Poriferisphaera corsica TaxID=2528020 RepID=A0A517YTU4_9BACT|nr:hypothetical protein [Poriferisphaera corsica]QDU33654.1 hypothetical protein KS4_17100 [Poriferisphaera corsica]